MNPKPSSLRAATPALLGLAACAACCTVPFLAPLLLSAGLGTAVLTWLSTRSELLGLACLLIGGSVAGFQWWRSRRAASCPADGSCGCRAVESTKSA